MGRPKRHGLWATPQQQSNNKRLRKNAVLWRGQLPKVWAAHWGVSYRAALRRIHKELETRRNTTLWLTK